MGVSGAGKSVVGRALSIALGCDFVEGDDLHPPANVARMAAGHPLTDPERAPWLDAIAAGMAAREAAGRDAVVACSALKRAYRTRLAAAAPALFILLDMPSDVLARRLAERRGHFMPATLLDSQLATLEPLLDDEPGIVVPVRDGIAETVAAIRARL